MADAAIRQLLMLQQIPIYPKKITASKLHHYLVTEGYCVTLRSVQRDLQSLSAVMPLDLDERSKPHGWFFPRKRMINIPAMDTATGLTFTLIEKYLKPMMPLSVLEAIDPYFKQSYTILEHNDDSKNKRWIKKVAFLPRGLQLRPAKIDRRVLSLVYEALLEEKTLLINYRHKNNQLIHPQGLVSRGSVIYLLATFWSYKKVVQLPLQRITKAKFSDEPYCKLPYFSLDSYIASGAFGITNNENMISLEVKFFGHSIDHLFETSLSDDQTIVEKDDYHILKASVRDTEELKWWLLGFGRWVEVVKPDFLRQQIKDTVGKMATIYGFIPEQVGE